MSTEEHSKTDDGQSRLTVGLGPDTNVHDIVRAYLKLHKFDGLVSDHTECGCHLDNFIICGGDGGIAECRPAYKFTKANGDWWMSTNKHWQESENDDA